VCSSRKLICFAASSSDPIEPFGYMTSTRMVIFPFYNVV